MITLELPKDYAWKKLLHLYNHSHCLEATEVSRPKEGVLEGVLERARPFWYRVEQVGSKLELSLTAPDGDKKPGKKDYTDAKAWAVRRFWLELDLEALREALEVNFYGFSLAGHFWPLLSPAYTSYWSALLRIYCGQRLDRVLRKSLGTPVVFGEKTYHLLPTPQQMMEVSSLQLQGLGLSSWSSKKLPHITQQFLLNPEVWIENLPTEPNKALALISKRFELGGTSAAWVLMRGAMHTDVALEGNHIRRALAEGLGLDKTPKLKEYQQLLSIHAPYRSFASYYIHLSQMALWRKNWSLEVP